MLLRSTVRYVPDNVREYSVNTLQTRGVLKLANIIVQHTSQDMGEQTLQKSTEFNVIYRNLVNKSVSFLAVFRFIIISHASGTSKVCQSGPVQPPLLLLH